MAKAGSENNLRARLPYVQEYAAAGIGRGLDLLDLNIIRGRIIGLISYKPAKAVLAFSAAFHFGD